MLWSHMLLDWTKIYDTKHKILNNKMVHAGYLYSFAYLMKF